MPKHRKYSISLSNLGVFSKENVVTTDKSAFEEVRCNSRICMYLLKKCKLSLIDTPSIHKSQSLLLDFT